MNQTTDEDYMRQALRLAAVALENGLIPVGAVLVWQGKVIVNGMKSGMTHPLFDHAEHNACQQALWQGRGNLAGITAYTTMEPCGLCLEMMMTTRVSRIVFAFPDPYGGAAMRLCNPAMLPARFQRERPTVQGGVCAAESQVLLRRFFEQQKAAGAERWSDPDNPLVQLALSEDWRRDWGGDCAILA